MSKSKDSARVRTVGSAFGCRLVVCKGFCMTVVDASPRPNIIAATVTSPRRDSYSVSQHAQIIPGTWCQTIIRSLIQPRLCASPPRGHRNMETPTSANRSTGLVARLFKFCMARRIPSTWGIWPGPYTPRISGMPGDEDDAQSPAGQMPERTVGVERSPLKNARLTTKHLGCRMRRSPHLGSNGGGGESVGARGGTA